MTTSTFTDTMLYMVSKYRSMLKKLVPQPERVKIHVRLDLKNPQLYENRVMLYNLGYKIIAHLKELDVSKKEKGYYSYSGPRKFTKHLEDFLNNYIVENNTVIHRAQKTSRALVKAIQLLTLPEDELNEKAIENLVQCNRIIAKCGSPEQQSLHKSTLKNAANAHNNASFYVKALSNFNQFLHERESAA